MLVRGATDGWVPYPFLDPRNGYGVVAVYCAGITIAVLVTAVLVWAGSRLHLPTAGVGFDARRPALLRTRAASRG